MSFQGMYDFWLQGMMDWFGCGVGRRVGRFHGVFLFGEVEFVGSSLGNSLC